MLRKIRRGVFETNSSSVHSLTIVSKEDYDKWQNGELMLDRYEHKLVTDVSQAKYSEDVQTYEEYWDECDFETFEEEHTTKSGDKIVAFGYYGHD